MHFKDQSFRINWWQLVFYLLKEEEVQYRNLLTKMRNYEVFHKVNLEGSFHKKEKLEGLIKKIKELL